MVKRWKTALNPKVWWKKNRRLNDLIRGFVEVVWDEFYDPGMVYPLTTKRGREIADMGLVIWDYILQEDPDALIRLLRVNENPRMSGRALAHAFLGRNFAWVQGFGIVDIEPWPAAVRVMDAKMLHDDFMLAQARLYQTQAFEDITELPDNEQHDEFVSLFNEIARPVTFFPAGSDVASAADITFESAVMHWDPTRLGFVGRFNYVLRATPRWRGGRPVEMGPFHRIYQQVRWQEVPLPYHAWDAGLMDSPE